MYAVKLTKVKKVHGCIGMILRRQRSCLGHVCNRLINVTGRVRVIEAFAKRGGQVMELGRHVRTPPGREQDCLVYIINRFVEV